MIKLYLALAVAAILAAAAFYVKSLTAEIAELSAHNAQLTLVAETNAETVKTLQETQAKLQQTITQLNTDLQAAEAGKDALIKKLQKHDLAALSAAKPKLIETRINNATKQVFTDLEQLTSD